MTNKTAQTRKKVTLETLDHSNQKKTSRLMRTLVVTLGILVLLGSGSYAAFKVLSGEVLTSRFTVVRMDCPACGSQIEKLLQETEGVVSVQVNYAAQTVIVDHHSKKVGPETLKQVIESARFGVLHEGTASSTKGVEGHALAALVNGKPLFEGEMVSLLPEFDGAGDETASELFFDSVAREILLQSAGSQGLIVNGRDLSQGLGRVVNETGKPMQELLAAGTSRLGSSAKYQQVLLQRLALQKYKTGSLSGNGEAEAWVAEQLRSANVEIGNPDLKRRLSADLGTADWDHLWPLMLSRNTQLRQVLAW
ncbi:MAG: heavy-metal-associated domain-containing protein [Desulfohalobiaceae bacterium]